LKNIIRKYISLLYAKATGFPAWRLTDPWPGGYGTIDGSGGREPLDLSAIYACARVIAGTLGSLPWHVYREDPKTGTREKATDHWLYPLVHDSPNAWQTSMEFRESLFLAWALRGNGYAEIVRMGKRVVSLNPLRPERMRPRLTAGGLVYQYQNHNGKAETYAAEDILHLKNFSLDGVEGITPIRQSILNRALDTQAYSANFMRNQGRPSGVLQSDKPRPKDPDTNEKLSQDWAKLYGGPDNAGKTAALWDGLKYQAITIPPEDAQYVESHKLNTADFSAIYGVPLNFLAIPDKTATYASAEHFDLHFAKHTVRPHAVRLEQLTNKKLLATEPNVYVELDLDALQRGDAASQATYFSTMAQNGIMKRSEIRRKLNLPEVPGADKLTVQSNLIDLDQLGKLSQQANPATASGDIRA
jgi:HK97 family phage portal protein